MSGRILWLRAFLAGLVLLASGWGMSLGWPEERPIRELIEDIRVERPIRHKNLTIFPLSLDRVRDRTRYLALDEALRKGVLIITELDGARVNEVEVENTCRHYVFLMAGELLTGCKQDRMVSDDCLLPPRSGKVRLRVYCTEHGRWTPQTKRFKSLGESAHIYMRQVAKATKSQDRVWEEVEEKRDELGVAPSETRAFKKVVEDRGVRRDVEPYLDKLGGVPGLARNVCGVVAAVGGRILVCDVFSSPDLFQRLWAKLLRSYVLDVVHRTSAGSVSLGEVEDFLRNAVDAQHSRGRTDGVGRGVEIQSRLVFGSALIYKGHVVHLDLFPRRDIRALDPALDLDMRRRLRED